MLKLCLVLHFLGESKQYTRHFQTREIEVLGIVLQEGELQPTADISAAEVLAKSSTCILLRRT